MRSWPHPFETIVVALRRWRCFARVEVGAKIVAGYAGGFLDLQNVFGGEGFCPVQPCPNRWLRDPDEARHRRLATKSRHSPLEGFERRFGMSICGHDDLGLDRFAYWPSNSTTFVERNRGNYRIPPHDCG